MTCENALGADRVHAKFSFSCVIAAASEWTVEPHLAAGAVYVERHAALGRRFLEGCLGLEIVDALVRGIGHAGK